MNIWAFPSFYPFEHPGKRWQGIFAHRQYQGLIDSGASLKVVQPVSWSPVPPFHLLDKKWKAIRDTGYPVERMYDGIKVYHPRVQNMKPARFYKPYNERYVQCIIDFFANNRITLNAKNDIFYSQWMPDAANVQVAAHTLGVKSAIMIIGDDVLIEPHRNDTAINIFKKGWQQADIRLAVADYLAKEANKITGQGLKYNVIRRGVNYDFFKPLTANDKIIAKKKFNIPGDKTIILTVGSAIERKGWKDLLDALRELKGGYSDFMLVGVHAGSDKLDLDNEAASRGLQDHFINLGEVPPAEVNSLMNTADIFCLPSHSEGIANAVVEAMACGLPVITTNICGHPEVIENGRNGILIEPKAPGQIHDALKRLLLNKEEMKSLGNNARNFIVHELGSFSLNAAKLYHIFQHEL